jgi:MATE family multidrug resistance protein
MIAQAYGRRDFADAMKIFSQGLGTAIIIALLIWIIQYLYVNLALLVIPCSPEVAVLAKEYYFIRIWAAPATLSLFVFKGFFIGMQNAISPMIADITVNVVNLLASIWFALHLGMGFRGIAFAVLLAQYTGLILCIILTAVYYRKLFKYFNFHDSLRLKHMKKFFSINGDLFVRSLCFLCVYAGFTSFSANYGDELLAVSTIMMKLLLLYSFFIDGFAFAGEALTGKYIGAQDSKSLKLSVKVIFWWCGGIALVSTFCYLFGGKGMVMMLTDSKQVIEDSVPFLPWLWVMPAFSCIAFTWDGIFIGATATRTIMHLMLVAVAGFFASYFLLKDIIGIQALYVAFMLHNLIRTVYMCVTAHKQVFARVKVQ